jgi:hypothetical protein
MYLMVAGKTVGCTALYGDENRMERLDALRLYTLGSAELSREENRKGFLSKGMYADIAVLSQDYFAVEEESIKDITSILTILGGKVVYAAEEFTELDQNGELPVSPDWSPVRHYGGYYQPPKHDFCSCHCHHAKKNSLDSLLDVTPKESRPLNPWSFGCDCFAY